jgi:hypothetical protein
MFRIGLIWSISTPVEKPEASTAVATLRRLAGRIFSPGGVGGEGVGWTSIPFTFTESSAIIIDYKHRMSLKPGTVSGSFMPSASWFFYLLSRENFMTAHAILWNDERIAGLPFRPALFLGAGTNLAFTKYCGFLPVRGGEGKGEPICQRNTHRRKEK